MAHREYHRSERIGWLRAAVLGAIAARAGGAPALTGAARVGFWGALAIAVTAGIARLFGTVVG